MAFVQTPLVEATSELRFAGRARIEAIRGHFQERVRSGFPHLLVPNVRPDVAPALQHYRFSNEAQTIYLSLAVNSLAYTTREYRGWDTFKEEVVRNWQTLQEELGAEEIADLTRVGVRYVNRFSADQRAHLLSFEKTPYLAALSDDVMAHTGTTLIRRESASLRVQVGIDGEGGDLVVDLDGSRSSVDATVLEETLDDLHAVVEEEFFGLLEPEYVARLREGSEEE